MSKRTKRPRVTEKDFHLVKKLQSAGLTNRQIATVTGRSFPTIAKVMEQKTLEDYRAAFYKPKQPKPVPYMVGNSLSTSPPTEDISLRLKTIEEQQAQILHYLQENFESKKVWGWKR